MQQDTHTSQNIFRASSMTGAMLKLILVLIIDSLADSSVAVADEQGLARSEAISSTVAATPLGENEGTATIFHFGEQCSNLASLSSDELRSLTVEANSRQFHRFCVLERGEECSEFAAFFVDLGGVFEASEWSDYCRFVPVGPVANPGRPDDGVDPCHVGSGSEETGGYDCG